MKKLLKYFAGIVPFFAAEGIQLLVVYALNIMYTLIVGFQIGSKNGIGALSNRTELALAIQEAMSPNVIYLISVLAVIVCGIVFYFWYRVEIRGEIRGSLSEVVTGKNMIRFVFLGIGCQFLLSGIMSLIQPIFYQLFDNYAEQMERLTSGSNIIVLLLLIFAAPIAEELVFRGVILHKTCKAIPFLGANILQALLFGIYHWNIIQGIYAALIGLLLGYVYRRYRTIFAPILLHMLINASSFFTMLFPESIISYLVMLAVGAIFVAVTLYLIKPFASIKREVPEYSTIE
jgi:membrane protease YdiL (CAAX protease family)